MIQQLDHFIRQQVGTPDWNEHTRDTVAYLLDETSDPARNYRLPEPKGSQDDAALARVSIGRHDELRASECGCELGRRLSRAVDDETTSTCQVLRFRGDKAADRQTAHVESDIAQSPGRQTSRLDKSVDPLPGREATREEDRSCLVCNVHIATREVRKGED